MADSYLSVVDNDDLVVGRQLRSVIHRTGLRHREVHVWFVTADGKLIFQRRSATKDTYPDMLDATVGGHVEEGQDYMAAALAEVAEESGLEVDRHDLIPLAKIDALQMDKLRGVTNRVFRMIYLYELDGEMDTLRTEEGDGAGFVAVPLADVLNQRGALIGEMVPGLFADSYSPAWQALRDVLKV